MEHVLCPVLCPDRLAPMQATEYTYYEARPDASHEYLLPIVRSMLEGSPADSVVLDLGCGNGSFLSRLDRNGWSLIGVDYSQSGIRIAKEHHPGIQFHLADAETDLLGLVGLVDVVISTEVIEHLYDPRAFLANAYRLLKPGGALIVSTPYHGYWKNLMLAATGKLDRHFTVLWDHGHIKFWSRQTLEHAISEAGFEVTQFRGAGRIPHLWRSMVVKAER